MTSQNIIAGKKKEKKKEEEEEEKETKQNKTKHEYSYVNNISTLKYRSVFPCPWHFFPCPWHFYRVNWMEPCDLYYIEINI